MPCERSGVYRVRPYISQPFLLRIGKFVCFEGILLGVIHSVAVLASVINIVNATNLWPEISDIAILSSLITSLQCPEEVIHSLQRYATCRGSNVNVDFAFPNDVPLPGEVTSRIAQCVRQRLGTIFTTALCKEYLVCFVLVQMVPKEPFDQHVIHSVGMIMVAISLPVGILHPVDKSALIRNNSMKAKIVLQQTVKNHFANLG